jgi:hypothetical protein
VNYEESSSSHHQSRPRVTVTYYGRQRFSFFLLSFSLSHPFTFHLSRHHRRHLASTFKQTTRQE